MSAPRRGGLGRGLGALIVDTSARPDAPDGPALATGERAPSATPARTAADVGARGNGPGSGSGPADGSPLAGDSLPGQSAATVAGTRYREVPVDAIEPNPRQPRSHVDEEPLAELAASVREVGLLQPVVVRETSPDRYELIMGERRWRACREAGLLWVPALVRETGDDALLRDALLENLHRVDLNPLDEAAAYGQLLDDFGATHEELASRVSRSRSHVTNTLRLLQLPPAVQRRVAAGVLSAGHARALLAVEDPEVLEALASRIVAEGLSVRAVEEEVALLRSAGRRRPVSRRRVPTGGMQELSDVLSDRFETRVSVTMGRAKGRIVVEFASQEDLQRILATMAPGTAVADGEDGVEDAAASPAEDVGPTS